MPEKSPIDSHLPSDLQRVRDAAVAAVLRRHDLLDKKFHNESLVHEVADEVANAIRRALG